MVDVSPPRIPKIFGPDGKVTPEGIRLFERFLTDLRLRTGGDDDAIENIQTGDLEDPAVFAANAAVSALEERVEDLEGARVLPIPEQDVTEALSNQVYVLYGMVLDLSQRIEDLENGETTWQRAL